MGLSVEESAARVGAHCWVERAFFAQLGAARFAAPAVPGPAVSLALDRWSRHAAWRADQWWDRLPVRAGVDREALIVAPAEPPGWSEAFALAADLDPAERVAAVARVFLPRQATAYEVHRAQAAPVSDSPALRTLGHVLPDLRADWAGAELLAQTLVVDAATLARVTAATGAVERTLLALA